jgi:hypothetical protein
LSLLLGHDLELTIGSAALVSSLVLPVLLSTLNVFMSGGLDILVPLKVAFGLLFIELNRLFVFTLGKTNNLWESGLLFLLDGCLEEVEIIESVLNIIVHVS